MRGLILAELRAGWATWVGITLVSMVAALACGIAVSMLETGIHAGEEYLQGFSGGTASILMFSLPSSLAVVAAIARLGVALGAPTYARWLLAGVSPAQVAVIVSIQLVTASLFGAIAGAGLTSLLAEPAVHNAFQDGVGGYTEIPILTGPLTWSVVVPLTMGMGLLGGLRAAIGAGRTSPLSALRNPEPRAKHMRWWRWILLAIVWAGVAALLREMFSVSSVRAFMSFGPLTPVLITLVLIVAGPVLYPLVLRGWTALVPARLSTSWYLARHQARYHLNRSTASITPLFTGAALLGGLFTMSATIDASMKAGGKDGVTLSFWQVLLMVGGPVLLAASGAAVVIFMSNRTQSTEQALLRACGATNGIVIRSALWQAVIHVVTAVLLAGLAIGATALVTAAAIGRFVPPMPTIDAIYAAGLVGVGLVLTVLATVLPAASRAHESLVRRLGDA